MLTKDQEIEYYRLKLEKEKGPGTPKKKNNNNNGSGKGKRFEFDINYMAKGFFKYPLGHLIMFAIGICIGVLL